MPALRGLTIVVVSADPERWTAALALASAQAALGGAARIYCHGAAVTRLVGDEALTSARELGVIFVACQTGLAEHDTASPDFAEAGGLISLLAGVRDDRLITL